MTDEFSTASDGRGAQGGSPVARRATRRRGSDRRQLDAANETALTAADTVGLRRTEAWRTLLRQERLGLGLTQAALARLVNISTVSLRTYEAGTRTPDRETLARLMVALQVPHDRGRRILEAAGYAPLDRMSAAVHPSFYFTLEEARREIEKAPWPRFVANTAMELVAINQAASDLCRFDWNREEGHRRRPQFHFLHLIAEQWFRDHVTNMHEMIAMLIGVLKGVPRGGGRLDRPNPYVQAVIDHFATLHPGGLQQLLDLWDAAPPMESKIQWTYPLVWEEPGVGAIRFHCMVTDAGEIDALAFNDWIPADAESHAHLAETLRRRAAERARGAATGSPGGEPRPR